MYRDMTVAVVVPAYNEEGFVGDVIDDLPEIVDRAYVVDDGSTDATWAEIREHAAARNATHDGRFDELVVPIQHEENRGVGGAIKTGYVRARDEEIDATAVLGGDDQMDPRELERYLDPIADGVADYTKGNRFVRPEDWVHMPKFRLLGNVVLSLLTKVASGYWGSMDSQNGYTAISLSALERTDIEGMYEYYGYCNDLLARLNAADVVVADVRRSTAYAYQDGWKSHIDYTEYIPRVSLMLFSAFLWRLKRKYLVRNYDPLAPLYGLGMASMAAGVTGVANAVLRDEGEDAGTWTLTAVVGTLTFLYASVRDMTDNEDLLVTVDPEADADATADEEAFPDAAMSAESPTADGGTFVVDRGASVTRASGPAPGLSNVDVDALPFDAVRESATGDDAERGSSAGGPAGEHAALEAALAAASDADHLDDVALSEVLAALPEDASELDDVTIPEGASWDAPVGDDDSDADDDDPRDDEDEP